MVQKHPKRTDQEWFALIQDCRSSSLKTQTWCEQHNITLKAFYYHARQLRQKGYAIPQRTAPAIPAQRQEVVCLGSPHAALSSRIRENADTAAIRIDFHGVFIEVSNQAAQDTIQNTFRALQGLC